MEDYFKHLTPSLHSVKRSNYNQKVVSNFITTNKFRRNVHKIDYKLTFIIFSLYTLMKKLKIELIFFQSMITFINCLLNFLISHCSMILTGSFLKFVQENTQRLFQFV